MVHVRACVLSVVLLCCLTRGAHASMSKLATKLHNNRVRRRRAAAARKKWEESHEKKEKRRSKERCDHGTSEQCYLEGLQGALIAGHGLTFCRTCREAHSEGLHAETWEGLHNPASFNVTGEIVFAVPNDASGPLMNVVGGGIVLVDRGKVSFAQKARTCQEAGAAAVIIVDNGSCGETFDCGGWLGSKTGNALAAQDPQGMWSGVYVPLVLVTQQTGERLRFLMALTEVEIPGLGTQVHVPDHHSFA